jgi:regulator of protease activity HflC (stomatin/prohibitin superfamily)
MGPAGDVAGTGVHRGLTRFSEGTRSASDRTGADVWREDGLVVHEPMLASAAGIAFGISAGAVVFVAVAIALVHSTFKVVTEYERAVFFRLGRIREEAKGPGIIVKWPLMDKLVKVTLRVEVVDIPKQAVITADNVTVQVDAVVYFQVLDPVQAIIGVDDFRFASQRVAMTALRSIVGRHQLDNILAHRDDVNNELKTSIGASTHSWGVEVRQVEIRDIVLPPELLRAMARQAEAERERRAKVIAATGELGASKELAEAAATLYESPGAMQLRTLQTLAEVASENNSTLVFPLPIEILAGFVNGTIGMSSPGAAPPGAAPATVPLSTVMPAPSVIKGAGARATGSPTATAPDASAGVADGLTDDGEPTDDGQSPAGEADADGVSQSA